MVGDIELRGRLPPSTRLATGAPSFSGAKLKSVSSLLRIEAVDRQARSERALDRRGLATRRCPQRSTATMCEVPGTSASAAAVTRGAPGGVPAVDVRRSRGRARSAPSARRDRRGRSARRPAPGRNRDRRDRPRGRHKRAASIRRSDARRPECPGPAPRRSNRSSCFRIANTVVAPEEGGPMPQIR